MLIDYRLDNKLTSLIIMKMLGKTELNFVEVTYFSQWLYVIHSAVLFSPGHTLETTHFLGNISDTLFQTPNLLKGKGT